jgi:hypothetical protein
LVHYDNSAVRIRIKKIRRKKLRNNQGGRVEGPEYQMRTAGIAMIRAMRNQEIMKSPMVASLLDARCVPTRKDRGFLGANGISNANSQTEFARRSNGLAKCI